MAIAQQRQLSGIEANIHLSLGNLFRAREEVAKALQQYEQASHATAAAHTQLTAQLNRFSLLVQQGDISIAQDLLPSIQQHLQALSPSQSSVYAHVNLAESLITLSAVIQDPASQNPSMGYALLTHPTQDPASQNPGQTNHIERLNNTFRQRISRLARKSLSFSKKLDNHIGAIWYFLHSYNAQLAMVLALSPLV